MERLEPTRGHALRIWWAVTWRTVAVGTPASTAILFLAGIAIGVLKEMLHFGPAAELVVRALVTLSVFILAVVLYVEIFFRVLQKRFKDFEIALIPSAGTKS